MTKSKVKDGWIIWEPNFFKEKIADEYYEYLLNKLPWKGGRIKLFGKEHDIPRKQVFFADEELSYSYSGKSLQKSQWDDRVTQIRSIVEEHTDTKYNACLANLYRDGNDSNGWHADNERELGDDPVIASLSFGVSRKFHLKHNFTKEKMSFELSHGSLLIMGGAMQHHWKHQIPKSKKVQDARVNLTFRKLY
jgi:alkylated DNA repair dioxygenase AlkB